MGASVANPEVRRVQEDHHVHGQRAPNARQQVWWARSKGEAPLNESRHLLWRFAIFKEKPEVGEMVKFSQFLNFLKKILAYSITFVPIYLLLNHNN